MKPEIIGPILEVALVKWAESAHDVVDIVLKDLVHSESIKRLELVDQNIEKTVYMALQKFANGNTFTMADIDTINGLTVENMEYLAGYHK